MNVSLALLLPFLPILVFVCFFSFMIFMGVRQAQRTREALSRLASELGLELHAGPLVMGVFPRTPTISGIHGGRRVRFFTFTTGSGKSQKTWRAVGVACANPKGLTMRLTAQGFLHKLGEMLGMQDVIVGDKAFDDRFVVKTNAPDFVPAALLPEIREALLSRWPSSWLSANLKIEGGEAVYAEMGTFSDEKGTNRLRGMLDVVVMLAALPEVHGGTGRE